MICITVGTVTIMNNRSTGPSADNRIIVQVRKENPQTRLSDEDIVSIAKNTCSELDNGISMENVVIGVASRYSYNSDYNALASSMVYGIKEICPRHIDKAKEFANGR